MVSACRYDNTRFHGHIPSYHLTMPRAFHRWDGHLYRRGLKICATSWMQCPILRQGLLFHSQLQGATQSATEHPQSC